MGAPVPIYTRNKITPKKETPGVLKCLAMILIAGAAFVIVYIALMISFHNLYTMIQ